uniref:LNS2 domain-containing protein n=1 Tax=Panagrellus redivivus TaxID=6233 RepID=A0A7E4WBB3_PANRE
MDFVYNVANNIKYFYNNMNSASLTGAIDVIVVEQPDGTLMSTPFHVRFGKYGVFNSDEKYVDIMINQEEIKSLKMKLAENGVAYFVQETDEAEVPEYLASSPVPTSPVSSDNESIEEASRKQKRLQQREESKVRMERKRFPASGSVSRSPSPVPRNAKPEKPEASSSKPALVSQHSVMDKQKMKLPYTSSIFSNRRNRSLPDLTTAIPSLSHNESVPVFAKGHSRQLTEGQIDSKQAKRAAKTPLTPQSPTNTNRSLSTPKSGRTTAKRPTEKFLFPEKSKNEAAEASTKTAPSTPVKSVKFATSSDDSDSDSKADEQRSNRNSVPKRPSNANLDAIADGALSDSEVDRTRNVNTPNDPEWNWGQFPETQKQNSKSEAAKSSEWRWLWWRSGKSEKKPEPSDEVYLDDLVGKPGVDPVQIERYLGKHGGAGSTVSTTTVDSGNGHSVATPASPSAMSMDSLNGDISTPTTSSAPRVTPADIAGALEKDNAINAELLAGTDERAPGPQTAVGQIVKQRQKSGNSVTSDGGILSDDELLAPASGRDNVPMKTTKHIRSLRLSSDELKGFGLQYGSNEARFSITTKLQGTSWCSCHIYLFKYSEKLIISDIDGTITKSDVLGHVIAAIGGQWAHTGVAELYTRIKNNGYKMVYLSSRAIGQSHYTKTYLSSLAQGSKSLPDGPVLLSPTSVLMAFRKEVIERRPEEFKIACLSDLKALFPVERPFYAGFGNRETDVRSYEAVDIPAERILIINPSGAVRRADQAGFVSSYSSMAEEIVDYLFPPLKLVHSDSSDKERMQTDFTKPESCSGFTHWRTPPSASVLVDDEIAAYERKRKEMAERNKASAKRKR